MVGSGQDLVLPSKLGKEPLVEAVFEMRFETGVPISTILPGILYSKLQGPISMEQLPAYSLPKELRDADPSLTHAPLQKMSWGNYWLLIGDKIFAVASKLPYRGWDDFRGAIETAFTIVLGTGLVTSVTRCSIKYVDLLDSMPFDAAECFSMNFSIGARGANGNNFHVNLNFVEDEVTHTIQVFSKAATQLHSGKSLVGPLIDVDSVMSLGAEQSNQFLQSLSQRAKKLHDANKKIIFESFSAQALAYLEPTYE